MSENRSQMSEGGRKGGAFFGEHSDGTPLKFSPADDRTAGLRKAGWRPLGSGYWMRDGEIRREKELLEEQTHSQLHDQDVLDRQADNLVSDGTEATLPGREKSASVEEVSRLRQTRDRIAGQRFNRVDEKVKRVPLNAEIESGDPDHEFLDGKAGAKAWRKTNRF
jgi:hypothetical protein